MCLNSFEVSFVNYAAGLHVRHSTMIFHNKPKSEHVSGVRKNNDSIYCETSNFPKFE